ncbi:MAG: amino acid ABC transporter substrate-binding protein, partial [Zoogloea oleivorans]|nr:amino acid ABC transporter substrate-binding protein [Zoogloea oleivorans]
MRTSLKLAASCLLIAGIAQPVFAQESPTLRKIKDSGTIALGHRESSIPFSYYDDKQQVVGYSQELMLKVVDA